MSQLRHFEIEIAELKRSIVNMGNLVDRALTTAVEGILHPTANVRDRVGAIEDQLDAMETMIEDRSHQILALQSPMARDLRMLISSMRISSDLEQIGDLSQSLAKRATYIACHQSVSNPTQLQPLARLVTSMVSRAMDLFVVGNLEVAKSLVADEILSDQLTKDCYGDIQALMTSDGGKIREYTHLLRAVSLLEHIGDIAISITEEAVYVHTGKLFRHNHQDMPEKPAEA